MHQNSANYIALCRPSGECIPSNLMPRGQLASANAVKTFLTILHLLVSDVQSLLHASAVLLHVIAVVPLSKVRHGHCTPEHPFTWFPYM